MTRTSILEFRSFRSLPDRDVEPAIFFGNGLRIVTRIKSSSTVVTCFYVSLLFLLFTNKYRKVDYCKHRTLKFDIELQTKGT